MSRNELRRTLMVGAGLALGLGSGLTLWGFLVEQEQSSAVLHTSLGVSIGMLLGFPVWAELGKRLHPLVRDRFRRWLVLGIGLGVLFGGTAWLLTAILTGRLGEGTGLWSLRVPLLSGMWSALLLGVGFGFGAARQAQSGPAAPV